LNPREDLVKGKTRLSEKYDGKTLLSEVHLHYNENIQTRLNMKKKRRKINQ